MLGGQGWAQHHHEHSGDARFRAAQNIAAVGQPLHPREALPCQGGGRGTGQPFHFDVSPVSIHQCFCICVYSVAWLGPESFCFFVFFLSELLVVSFTKVP